MLSWLPTIPESCNRTTPSQPVQDPCIKPAYANYVPTGRAALTHGQQPPTFRCGTSLSPNLCHLQRIRSAVLRLRLLGSAAAAFQSARRNKHAQCTHQTVFARYRLIFYLLFFVSIWHSIPAQGEVYSYTHH